MGFFDGISNWFRGAFGGNDDEEKKRRQQQQQQRPAPKLEVAKPRQQDISLGYNPQQTRSPQQTSTVQPSVSPQLYQADIKQSKPALQVQSSPVLKVDTARPTLKIDSNTPQVATKYQQDFNSMNYDDQQKTVSGLKSLADRKEFSSAEDARNSAWARERLKELSDENVVKSKNPQDVGDYAKILWRGFTQPAEQIASSVVDTAQEKRRAEQLQQLYQQGKITREQFLQAGLNIYKNSIQNKVVVDDKGNISVVKKNPLEFGQKFSAEGADAAITYSPVGTSWARVLKQPAETALKSLIKAVGKEGTAYTVADTGNDVIHGRDVNPETIASSAVFSYGGAAAGGLGGRRQASIESRLLSNSLGLSEDAQKLLKDAGITDFRIDPASPYAASYADGTITGQSQKAIQDNIYHEAGHSLWENQLTPDEKALFTGQGQASQQAVGREGYTQADINSEDFSDYLNKALTGRMDEVPEQYRAVISKYSGITAQSNEAAASAARTIANNQEAQLAYIKAANPNLTQEQLDAAMQAIKLNAAQLADKARQSREQILASVKQQGDQNAATTDALAQQAQDAQAARVAAATPQEGDRLQTPQGNAEVQANDAYKSDIVEPFKIQDANQEKLVHSSGWNSSTGSGVAREKLENAGDIFRELSGLGMPGYVQEKVDKLRRYVDGKTFVHPDDSYAVFAKDNPERLAQYLKMWQDQPVNTSAQQIAKDLNIALVQGDFAKVQKLLDDIENLPKTERGNYAGSQSVYRQQVKDATPSPRPIQVTGDDRTGVNIPVDVQPPNAYKGMTNDQILYGDQTPDVRGNLTIPQLLSPDRLIRENLTRPIQEGVNTAINAAQRSQFAPIRGVGRMFTGFSREAGRSAEDMTAAMKLRGGVETGKFNRDTIAELSKGMTPDQKTQVWATLDPERATELGIDPAAKLSPAQVDLQQKLKTVIDNTTQENFRRGLITEEQSKAPYIKRAYTMFEDNPEQGSFERGFRSELLNQYRGRKDISDQMVQDAITDPTYLVGKKSAESEAVWAMQDYGNYLVKAGRVSDVPLQGYTQLPEKPIFGEASGKWIPQSYAEDFTGFQYSNSMVQALNDVFQIYDRWNVRQAKKQLLTIFNPAVRLGNQVTNRGIFAQLAGVNPIHFNTVYAETKYMMDRADPIIREAISQGLTGIDITQAEFYAKHLGDVSQDSNIAKKAVKWLQDSYSGADDQARITAYVIKRRQGYSPEEAARQVQRGFQDYKSVGFFYDLAAKTPLIGNAFVRFAADSIRIAKNTAVEHPLRAIATIALWNTFVNGMSVASGESDLSGDNLAQNAAALATGSSKSDAQKTREDRFGAAKLPFSDVSMAVQTPWGEVNVARFMPWYQLNDINQGVQKFLPYSEPPFTINDGKVQFNGSGWQDPLLGQVAQLAADKDFRNKSIQDPNNNAQGDKYAFDQLPLEDKLKNVGRFLFTQNVPLGREADAVYSAATGQEDVYGKMRSLPQAAARALGFKVEQFGQEQVAKQKGTEAYFQDLSKIDEELKTMNPGEQEAWKRLTGYYKLRDQVENKFDPGKLRDKKAAVYDFSEDKWKDYASNPRLYDLMVQKKQQDNARDGQPIQPEFDERLSQSFRKQLIQNKMVAPGDDAELDQRMYSTPEWDYYQKLKTEYKDAANKYYGKSEFTGDELVKNQDAKFPDKPAAYKAYTEAYGKYANGKGEKPEFTDAVKKAREQYQKDTFNWTNNARLARGLPAITWDMWNNPTFGYDEKASGFYGGGYGGGGGSNYQNTLTSLTNFADTVNGNKIRTVEAQNIPNEQAIFRGLLAGQGGGKRKPKLGASSRGQG